MNKKIDLFRVFMAPTAAEEVGKVLNSGYIGQGPKVEEFESQLKTLFRHDYVTTLNSGTSGLHLALHLLRKPSKNVKTFDGVASYESNWPGWEPGDEVYATFIRGRQYHVRLVFKCDRRVGHAGGIDRQPVPFYQGH